MDAPLSVLLRDGTHEDATTRLALKAEQVSVSYTRSVIQVPQVQLSPIILDMGMVRPAVTISGVVDTIGGDPTNTGSANTAAKTWHMESMSVGGQTYYVPYKNYLENKLITWISDDGYDLQIEIGNARVSSEFNSSLPNNYMFDNESDGPGLTASDTLTAAVPTESGTDPKLIPVTDTANFAVDQYIAILNSTGITSGAGSYELMKVEALTSSTVLTVARDQKGTNDEEHLSGAIVYSVGLSPSAPTTGGAVHKISVQQIQFSVAPGMEDRWIYSIQCVAKFREDIKFP